MSGPESEQTSSETTDDGSSTGTPGRERTDPAGAESDDDEDARESGGAADGDDGSTGEDAELAEKTARDGDDGGETAGDGGPFPAADMPGMPDVDDLHGELSEVAGEHRWVLMVNIVLNLSNLVLSIYILFGVFGVWTLYNSAIFAWVAVLVGLFGLQFHPAVKKIKELRETARERGADDE